MCQSCALLFLELIEALPYHNMYQTVMLAKLLSANVSCSLAEGSSFQLLINQRAVKSQSNGGHLKNSSFYFDFQQ